MSLATLGSARGAAILNAVALAWAITPALPAQEPRALTRVAEVRDLSRAEADRQLPVKVHGVVTALGASLSFYLDDGAGIYAWDGEGGDAPKYSGPAVTVGDVVDVEGVTAASLFAPVIAIRSIRVAGHGPLPAPSEVTAVDLMSGKYNSQRVAIRGIAQAVAFSKEGPTLDLACEGGHVAALLDSDAPLDPKQWVDAEVRVAGVNRGVLTNRGELIGNRVVASAREELTIERPPSGGPWEAPRMDPKRPQPFSPQGFARHRVRATGIVTFCAPGEFLYLQQDKLGLRVQISQREPLGPGDRIEAAGFAEQAGHFVELKNAVFRRISSGSPPPPVEIDPEQIYAIRNGRPTRDVEDVDGRLVSLRGVIQGIETTADGGARALVRSGAYLIPAALAPDPGAKALAALLPGSEVRVTGVCVIDFSAAPVNPWRSTSSVTGFRLMLREAGDVAVLRAPPWWTPRRLGIALGGTGTVLAVALAWAVLLRRQVSRQMAVIGEKLRGEAVGAERNRVARDLHDTLEQHLAGVALHLDGAEEIIREDPKAAAEAVLLASRMLRHTREEARRSVWDLRSQTLEVHGLAAALKDIARSVSGSGPEVEVRVAGEDRALPLGADYQLLRVAQEALANALKHSGAKRIVITLENTPEATRLVIRDDGRGFEPGALERENGSHFGVLGMRERAARIGAALSIDGAPGNGCAVTLALPCPRIPHSPAA